MNIIVYCSIILLSLSSWAGHGTFSSTKGKVYLKKEGRKESRARRGKRLSKGDTVRTDASSYAKITMSDKNVLHVGPKTQFTLKSYDSAGGEKNESLLNVAYGKVRAALDKANKYDGKSKTFRVTTEAAVMGVRGTDFLTEHSQSTQTTRTTTIETGGAVSVWGVSPTGDLIGKQDLTTGQMTLVQMGQPPFAPIDLPSDLLQEVITGSQQAKKSSSLKKESQKKLDQAAKSQIPSVPQDALRPGDQRKSAVPKDLNEHNNKIESFNGGGNKNVNVDVEDDTST